MDFKDLQVLVLLVWLCLGHTFEVGAQVEAPGGRSPLPSPPPSQLTKFQQWTVAGNLTSLERNFTTILSNGTFSFNLVLTNQSKSSCAAIVQHNPSNTTVWVANFNVDNPNEQNSASNSIVTCFLSFTNGSGLVLSSSNDKEIWSTNLTGSDNFNTLQLDNSSCLYIRDTNAKGLQKPVWTSFAHPSDTLVKGQHLMPGTWMSAAQLDQNYLTGGVFYMHIIGTYMTLYQDFKANGVSRCIPYSSFSNTTQNNMQNIDYVEMENSGLVFYDKSNGTLFSTASGSDIWDYARLESNGSLVLKTYDSGRQRELVGIGDKCLLPAECGSFGICSQNGTCKCPPEGFKQANNAAYQFTCERLPVSNTTSLDCQSYTKLVNVTGQTYLSISDVSTAAGDINNITTTDCKERCFGNCSCNIALHVRQDVSNPLGACFLNLDSIQTIRQGVDNSGDLQMLFLRINGTDVIPFVSSGGGNSRRTAASAFAGGAGALVLVLLAVSAWWLVHTRRKYFAEAEQGLYDSAAAGKLPSQLPPQFTYNQLAASTSNFAQRLGSVGHSSVYSGILPNSTKIAVKKLDDKGHKDKEFLAAVATMCSLSHPNLVPLVGYCKEGKHKMLVYELVNEGRSLNWFLFNNHDSGPLIDASKRRSIALGTARGLQHLHEDYNTGGIIHGGVKPENLMIDRDMHPRLVDYGLVNLSSLSSRFATLHSADSHGSRGYMAPEWKNDPSVPLTAKVDVYSLGVVILELVSGRRCLEPEATSEEKRYLPTWGFSIVSRDNNDLDSVAELADPRLDIKALSEVDQQVLKGMTFVALWCVQEDPKLRPPMDQVVRMLEGYQTVNAPPSTPALEAYASELCASRQGREQQGFTHSPSLSENSDMRHSAFCCPRMKTENSRHDHTWLLQT